MPVDEGRATMSILHQRQSGTSLANIYKAVNSNMAVSMPISRRKWFPNNVEVWTTFFTKLDRCLTKKLAWGLLESVILNRLLLRDAFVHGVSLPCRPHLTSSFIIDPVCLIDLDHDLAEVLLGPLHTRSVSR